MPEQSFFLIFPGIAFLLGIIFGAIAIGMRHSALKKRRECTAQTVGRVSGCQKRTETDMDGCTATYWYPVFSYYANGAEYAKTSSIGRTRPKFQVGQSVNVFYDPSNPERYYVPAENFALFPKLFGTVSVILFAACAIVLAVYLHLSGRF